MGAALGDYRRAPRAVWPSTKVFDGARRSDVALRAGRASFRYARTKDGPPETFFRLDATEWDTCDGDRAGRAHAFYLKDAETGAIA